MPCYSNITETKIKDHARLIEVLDKLGIKYRSPNKNTIHLESGASFTRRNEKDAFTLQNGDQKALAPIAKKYAELGVRAFAKRNGYSVLENDGTKMTLVNRRSGKK